MSYIDGKKSKEKPELENDYRDKSERFDLALAIMQLREAEGLSQMRLAEKSGKAQSTIACIERGTLSPSYRVLCDIARGVNKRVVITFV